MARRRLNLGIGAIFSQGLESLKKETQVFYMFVPKLGKVPLAEKA